MTEPLISCENLVKIYQVEDLEVVALQGLDLVVQRGELLGLVGASGSGKSTLLNIIGGLDRPSAGRISVNGRNLIKLSDQALDEYRRNDVGFVWQQTARNLIPFLSARENIELPMTLAGQSFRRKRAWSQELLHAVGLWEHRKHRLAQLSGGQQQRVAIAVALANRPRLLLGDEPTGEVDSITAGEIMELFQKLGQEYGLTTIIVTHDPAVASSVTRVVTIRDGRTSSESIRRQADVEAALARSGSDEHTAEFEEYVVVDAAGRLQIPPEMRQQSQIGRRVTLEVADGGIVLRPASGQSQTGAPAAGPGPDSEPESKARGWRRWLKRLRP
jgi:ABC-type lipoprotein export system ATPase subunit/bifunctional DNA-binding transcriptional regulator/antitoxin component of YhaV-PrlF toxin-antitoxin module